VPFAVYLASFICIKASLSRIKMAKRCYVFQVLTQSDVWEFRHHFVVCLDFAHLMGLYLWLGSCQILKAWIPLVPYLSIALSLIRHFSSLIFWFSSDSRQICVLKDLRFLSWYHTFPLFLQSSMTLRSEFLNWWKLKCTKRHSNIGFPIPILNSYFPAEGVVWFWWAWEGAW